MRRRLAVGVAGLVAAAVGSVALAACAGGGGGGGGGSTRGPAAAGGAGGAGAGAGGTGPRVVVADGTAGQRLSPFPDRRLMTGGHVMSTLPGVTDLEAGFREELEKLDGFGVYAPIAVTFDGDIDVATIADANVLVVNVQGTRAGEVVPLDLGRGSFPTDFGRPVSFHGRDPLAGHGDLLFPPGNPGSHYEAASRTVILRPLVPLEEGATYAVVLTDGLRGAGGGGAVQAPSGWLRPTTHDAILGPALGSVARNLGQIGYQWEFPTGRPSAGLRLAADAIDGTGPLAAALSGPTARPRLERFDDLRTGFGDGSPYTFDAFDFAAVIGGLADLARLAGPLHPIARDLEALLDILDLSCVDYIATGSAICPDLRTSPRGTWDLDPATAAPVAGRVPFLVVVPRPCAENGFAQPPYPVLLYGHGSQRSRLDAVSVAAFASRYGFAVVAIDVVDHGPDDALTRLPQLVGQAASGDQGVEIGARAAIIGLALALNVTVNPFASVETQARQLLAGGPLGPLFADGRATDVDGDGYTDSGRRFFTSDVPRSRDNVRQSVLDFMSVLRVVRGLGVDLNGNGRLDPQEGDLDRDGTLDFGGPGAAAAYVGISQGGICGSVLAGTDPTIPRFDVMVPGGGLVDIVTTSTLRSVTGTVFTQALGPVIVGQPDGAGGAFVDVAGHGRYGRVPTAPGGIVSATNLRIGLRVDATVAPDGGFVLHLRADQGDAIEVESVAPGGALLGARMFAAPTFGLGLTRSSPDMREYFGLAATVLEGADPVVFAPYWRNPAPGRGLADVLAQVSLGDTTVPVFTGASIGRAAGLLSLSRNQRLAAEGVLLSGTSFNGDRVLGVESSAGAGIRFLGVNNHSGMLVPDPGKGFPAVRYAAAAQRQAFDFLRTGRIDDGDAIFDVILR